jgi:hypothetical protein
MKTKTIFFTPAEVKLPENRSKGIKTPGWNIIQEWTDSNGNTRRRVEPLVINSVATESSVESKVVEEIKQDPTENVIKTKAKSK